MTLRQNSKARTQEPELAIDVWLICYAIESKARKSFSLLPDCVGIKVNSIIRNSITARHSKALEQLFVAFHAFIDQVEAWLESPAQMGRPHFRVTHSSTTPARVTETEITGLAGLFTASHQVRALNSVFTTRRRARSPLTPEMSHDVRRYLC